MYEAHFGLKSRPFGSKAEGTGVFSGPRQVETMTNLKKGLTALDAVVSVTGPVGVGKTTIVSRALNTISPNRMAAWVGRMQLAPDEVLQLLLAGFGISAKAKGNIQRFAVFRRLLAERAAAGAPVAIVVEDAHRIGIEALVELEALTAADTGDATSANIILMGQPDLKKLLARPELARLNQRTRLRQAVLPLSPPEVNGYLKHCIRAAGGDYDRIFQAGVAEIVYACSEGIPRMINTLCQSALAAAMEDGLKTVSAAVMHKVAVDAFGYEGPLPETVADVAAEDSMDVPIIEVKVDNAEEPAAARDEPEIDWEAPRAAEAEEVTAAEAERDEPALPYSARNIVVESGRYPELPEIPEDSPLATSGPLPDAPAVEPAAETTIGQVSRDDDGPEIPELINDTQPDLSTLKVPQTDEAVVDVLDVDTDSTAIQEQLPDAAIPTLKPVPATAHQVVANEHTATANDAADDVADDKDDKDDTDDTDDTDDDKFDLDAVLSIDTDATNVMEGITPNLDDVAANANDEDVDSRPPPELDNLPTLTDSMQVGGGDETRRERKADAAVESPGETLPAERPAPAVEKTWSGADPNLAKGTPTVAGPEQEAPVVEPKPVAARIEATKLPVGSEAAPEVTDDPNLESGAESEPEKMPASSPVTDSDPDLIANAAFETEIPIELAEEAKAPAATPIAQVSEMTARVAAIDPASRASDVDALEAALDAAKSGRFEEMMAPPPLPKVDAVESVHAAEPAEEKPSEPVPEITLDKEIAKKRPARPIPAEFVAKIGAANSLEEFSDAMAETLFGNDDLDQIAAAVIANPPSAEDSAELELQPEAAVPAAAEPAAEHTELTFADDDPAPSNTLAPPPTVEFGGLRESQQMRADMLQSLNVPKKPAAAKPQNAAKMEAVAQTPVDMHPKPKVPEPIENQIDISMSQTLEALDVAKMADQAAAEKEEKVEKKGGLFSRFRKSS